MKWGTISNLSLLLPVVLNIFKVALPPNIPLIWDHILNQEFTTLPSGRHLRYPICKTNRFKNSFMPVAVRLLNNTWSVHVYMKCVCMCATVCACVCVWEIVLRCVCVYDGVCVCVMVCVCVTVPWCVCVCDTLINCFTSMWSWLHYYFMKKS